MAMKALFSTLTVLLICQAASGESRHPQDDGPSQYVLHFKLLERSAEGKTRTLMGPSLAFPPNQVTSFHAGGTIPMPGKGPPVTVPPGKDGIEAVRFGSFLRTVVSPLDAETARVDISVEKANVVDGGEPDAMVVVGRTMRVIKNVELNKKQILVLEREASGTPRLWAEFQLETAPSNVSVSAGNDTKKLATKPR